MSRTCRGAGWFGLCAVHAPLFCACECVWFPVATTTRDVQRGEDARARNVDAQRRRRCVCRWFFTCAYTSEPVCVICMCYLFMVLLYDGYDVDDSDATARDAGAGKRRALSIDHSQTTRTSARSRSARLCMQTIVGVVSAVCLVRRGCAVCIAILQLL